MRQDYHRERPAVFPLVGAFIICWSTGATAQSEETMPLTRLSEPIVFDGSVDDPAWDIVPALPLTVYQPTPAASRPSVPRSGSPTTMTTSTSLGGCTTQHQAV